jgi:hypothetical protein
MKKSIAIKSMVNVAGAILSAKAITTEAGKLIGGKIGTVGIVIIPITRARKDRGELERTNGWSPNLVTEEGSSKGLSEKAKIPQAWIMKIGGIVKNGEALIRAPYEGSVAANGPSTDLFCSQPALEVNRLPGGDRRDIGGQMSVSRKRYASD